MQNRYTHIRTESEARHYVKKLAKFYRHLGLYAVVNCSLVFIWLVSGASHFWPFWVILGWGVPLTFKAAELNLLPEAFQNAIEGLLNSLPFLHPTWEDEQVNQILKKSGLTKSASKTAPKAGSSLKKARPKLSPSKMASVAPVARPAKSSSQRGNDKINVPFAPSPNAVPAGVLAQSASVKSRATRKLPSRAPTTRATPSRTAAPRTVAPTPKKPPQA